MLKHFVPWKKYMQTRIASVQLRRVHKVMSLTVHKPLKELCWQSLVTESFRSKNESNM